MWLTERRHFNSKERNAWKKHWMWGRKRELGERKTKRGSARTTEDRRFYCHSSGVALHTVKHCECVCVEAGQYSTCSSLYPVLTHMLVYRSVDQSLPSTTNKNAALHGCQGDDAAREEDGGICAPGLSEPLPVSAAVHRMSDYTFF